MQKRVATVFVSELRIHSKASADRMCVSYGPRKTHMHGLRKLLAPNWSNMNVAMQSRTADAVGLDYDDVVWFFRSSHRLRFLCWHPNLALVAVVWISFIAKSPPSVI